MKIVKNDIEFKGEKYKAVIEIGLVYEKVTLYKSNKVVAGVTSREHGFVLKTDFLSPVIEIVKDYAETKDKWEREKEEMCRKLVEWDGKIDV